MSEDFLYRIEVGRRRVAAYLMGLEKSLLEDSSPTEDVEVLACLFLDGIGTALLARVPIPPLVENWTRMHPMTLLRAAQAYFEVPEERLPGRSNEECGIAVTIAFTYLTGRRR